MHGIGCSTAYFHPLARELAVRGWRVVAVDLAGHGRSPQPRRALTVPEQAGAVAASLAEEGLVEQGVAPSSRPVLLGHSLGGQVVAALAAAHQGLARSLVLLGPTTDARARSALRQGARLLRNSPREPLSLAPVQALSYLRCGPRTYLGTVAPMLADRVEDHLTRVDVPLLLARGEHDPVAPRAWLRLLAGRLPRAVTAEVAGARHVAQWSHPREVAGLVDAVA